MDEKHPKSSPGKDTNLTVNKCKKTFIDFTQKNRGKVKCRKFDWFVKKEK